MQIPDSLCCKITLVMMQDPYITATGITYEKDALLQHINTNGYFDPLTRLATLIMIELILI